MAVIMSALGALVAIVLWARWETWRRDDRAGREDYSVSEWLDGAEQHNNGGEQDEAADASNVEDRYHDVERDGRAYMTVDAIKIRITREHAEAARRRTTTEHTSPLPRVRPSPYPRGGRRAAER